MGANAQTTVPSFTVGQVLTADQQNQSARTGVPVFATTVERDAAFGGSGEKTLAEGQLAYLEDSDIVQYYDGSGWATVGPATPGALVFITGASFSAVASVSAAASTFTSTYDNYLVLFDVSSVSTTLDVLLRFRTGGVDASAGYFYNVTGITPAAGTSVSSIQILDDALVGGVSFGGSAALNVFSPQLARNTNVLGSVFTEAGVKNGVLGGGLYNTTTYDAFTFLTSTGTMTGNYRVYGYVNS